MWLKHWLDDVRSHIRHQPPEAKRWMCIGGWFQGTMMVAFLLTVYLAPSLTSSFTWRHVPNDVGIALFLWCLYWLYLRNRSITELIETGPYRWTRHPMYLGLLLMDSGVWVDHPLDHPLWFYVLQAVFLICLLIASYCQERETLARFGAAAAAYYIRTPRVPFIRWRDRNAAPPV